MDAARDAMHAAGQSSPSRSVKSGRRAGGAESPPLEHAVGDLWDELRGLLHDQVLLASLESRQAVASLMRSVILALGCVVLLVGAWAAATAATLMWLVDTGLSIALALTIVGGGTLLLGAALFWGARESVRGVAFPATLRRLANTPLPGIRDEHERSLG